MVGIAPTLLPYERGSASVGLGSEAEVRCAIHQWRHLADFVDLVGVDCGLMA
jgi:hypothetical protein